MTLTCKIGRFIFDSGLPLSKMKLIRDTVMAQLLNEGRRRFSEHDCLELARQHFKDDSAYLAGVVVL